LGRCWESENRVVYREGEMDIERGFAYRWRPYIEIERLHIEWATRARLSNYVPLYIHRSENSPQFIARTYPDV
jgi:hypothetical protein